MLERDGPSLCATPNTRHFTLIREPDIIISSNLSSVFFSYSLSLFFSLRYKYYSVAIARSPTRKTLSSARERPHERIYLALIVGKYSAQASEMARSLERLLRYKFLHGELLYILLHFFFLFLFLLVFAHHLSSFLSSFSELTFIKIFMTCASRSRVCKRLRDVYNFRADTRTFITQIIAKRRELSRVLNIFLNFSCMGEALSLSITPGT